MAGTADRPEHDASALGALEFILQALEAVGCDRVACQAALDHPEGGARCRRMLLAIALDVASNALDVRVLAEAIRDTDPNSDDVHGAFCSALGRRVGDDFAKCVAASTGDELAPTESYVALLHYHKYAFFFRRRDGVAIGSANRATEVEYLRFNAEFDDPLPVELHRELRGQYRPISWITRSSVVERVLSEAPLDRRHDAVLELIEQLGLTWPQGVEHDVFLLRYPAAFDRAIPVGRPNSFSECWDGPGLFVPAATNDGWGQTCGRTRSDHPGMPERIHAPVPASPERVRFTLAFVASVVLDDSDPDVAAAEAARRWAGMVTELRPPMRGT